ncbi:hypothetical protein CI105_05905 [Candidatus Izimaplasma bacterium ZiA1]|uniref:aminopeptidase P family protein n=1 Tax=Candidatus Izimoplasma sp. ZiA1 TaxID=2024899 RepID=UPI000BAA72D1|nr:hypothetical protein CI105_05905 [Candidatus Izimaplasma bacterium ZiA1]
MNNTYKENRKKLFERMSDNSMLILFSGQEPHRTLDQFYKYTPNRNFYFLTGLNEPKCKLLMIKSKDKTFEYLFIEETTEYMRQWVGEAISKEEVAKISEVDKVLYLSEFENTIRSLMTYGRGLGVKPPKKLYLDLYRVTPTAKPIALTYADFIIGNFKELKIKNANEHISYLRMFKSDFEVSEISKAIEYTKAGLERLMSALKFRTNEQQLEADFLHEISLLGSEGNSFDTIAANGGNATVLHYINNNDELKQGNMVLLDLGALHNNYASDITRTYPINGKYTDRQKVIYDIVLKVNKESIKFIKPGISWNELNKFAKDLLIKETKAIGLIKEDAEINKYYYHSIGHFLGLDVHDVGQYDLVLEEGMVLTIEPGLYIKEEGIGVRIEDDILVTKDGHLNLSKDIIKETKDIEEFMKRA